MSNLHSRKLQILVTFRNCLVFCSAIIPFKYYKALTFPHPIHHHCSASSSSLQIIDYLSKHYQLNQKEIIVLGAVLKDKKISGYELSKILQLGDDRLRNWIDNLVDKKILTTEGKTKGLMYMINPKILSSVEHDLKPSLKTMEEPHLKALIKEDLKLHSKSKISEIHTRIEDLDISYLRKIVYKMYDSGEINREGEKKNMVYFLANKK